MVDEVVQEFSNICDTFKEMRDKMRNSQKYSGKSAATDKLYEAIRKFAPRNRAFASLHTCGRRRVLKSKFVRPADHFRA